MPPLIQRLVLWLLALGCGLLLVAWLAPSMVSPGLVTQGHAKFEAQCSDCHQPFLGPSVASCTACHPAGEIAPAKAAFAALHRLPLAADCLACHTDHQGRDPALGTNRFAHAVLDGGGLSSGRADTCVECHAKPADTLHAKLGGTCVACHGTEAWSPADYDHGAYFRFDRHHPADCGTCHVGPSFATYTCYECHEHSPASIRHEHEEEGIRDYEACAVCHRSGDEHEAKRLWRDVRRRGLQPSDAARKAVSSGGGTVVPRADGQPWGPPALGEHEQEGRHGDDDDDDDDDD